jgi:hypothetical protein
MSREPRWADIRLLAITMEGGSVEISKTSNHVHLWKSPPEYLASPFETIVLRDSSIGIMIRDSRKGNGLGMITVLHLPRSTDQPPADQGLPLVCKEYAGSVTISITDQVVHFFFLP